MSASPGMIIDARVHRSGSLPTLIEMRLKATWAVSPDTRQLHGLACALFEAGATGHLGQDKQFTVQPLQPVLGTPGEWTLRAAWLPDTPAQAGVSTADELRVGHVRCLVAESTQRRVTHAALAAGRGLNAVTVSFTSPTYFSQNGVACLVPDPRLVAGSWRRRWNTTLPGDDPLAITEDPWHAFHRAFGLSSFELRTDSRDSGHSREQAGFTGTATFRLARNAPETSRKILATLARFAEYCGTGAQTTHGFGATALAVAGDGPDG
jgi:CRISPR-associated endoribonuclease Cas6